MKKPSYFPKKPQGFLCHSLDITFAILENERRIKGDVKGWLKAFDEILCFLKHNYADNIIDLSKIANKKVIFIKKTPVMLRANRG